MIAVTQIAMERVPSPVAPNPVVQVAPSLVALLGPVAPVAPKAHLVVLPPNLVVRTPVVLLANHLRNLKRFYAYIGLIMKILH